MARIVDLRVMTKHLDTARQAIRAARNYQKTHEETGKDVFKGLVVSFVRKAEEQIAMAELYITEDE